MKKQIFPTKSNLLATKKTLSLSTLGFELLDKKRNVLIRELMQYIDKAKDLKGNIQDTFTEAYASLEKANVTLGILQPIAKTVPIEEDIHITYRSVMGVELPLIQGNLKKINLYYSLENTNSFLDDAYIKFDQVKRLCLELAEVENAIYRLCNGIIKTKKRANALQHILIPELQETEKFISEALEEKEREEFSRLKILKAYKEKNN